MIRGTFVGMDPICTLLDRTVTPYPAILPEELRRLYGGDLSFPAASEDRPYVIGNFASTIDGIVSYQIPGKEGGGDISGHNEPDRFIMGLLRASADAVIIGAGTLHATAREHRWTANSIYPEAAALERYRKNVLGKAKQPSTVVVSASGVVDLDRPMFHDSALEVRILTTAKGRDRLHAAGTHRLPGTQVTALEESFGAIAPRRIVDFLSADCGAKFLLHEGGPTLFGQFVAARLVDEFFLTLAPQIAGCDVTRPRPTMVWGTEFPPDAAPWLQIRSLKQSGNHLYLRYTSRQVSTQS